MRNFNLFLLFFVLLTGCKETEKKALKEVRPEELAAVPFDTVQQGEVTIEVYDFKNFEAFLRKENDSIYIVNFWATWCKPCVKELPEIEQIQKDYADKNVKVILASLDFSNKIESQLIPFVKKMELRSKILVLDEPDANAWIPKVDTTWSGAIPATLVYNRKQRIFFNKPLTYDELQKTIDELIITKK